MQQLKLSTAAYQPGRASRQLSSKPSRRARKASRQLTPQDMFENMPRRAHVILQQSTRSSDEPLNEIEKWTGTWGP